MKQVFTPYLCVKNAKEAIDFYIKAFDGKMIKIQYADENNEKSRVMHCELEIMGATLFVADESQDEDKTIIGNNVQVAVEFTDKVLQKKVYDEFVNHGSDIKMELQETYWNSIFALLVDKYGIYWLLSCDI